MARQPKPAGWFEIHVGDLARGHVFYETVFQSKLHPMASAEPDMQMPVVEGDCTAPEMN